MLKKVNQKKIIIIGAGIAGLAACTRLIEYGFDAMILEARNRSGGRIWTDDTLGIPLGRGAGWIHGVEGNPIALLAKHSHTKMEPVDSNKFITFDRNGYPIPDADIQKFNIKFDELLKQAKELAYHSKHDISLASALSDIIKSKKFSPVESDLLEKQIRYFERHIGASYEFLSARYWDHEEMWPGENCFLTTSYQPIIEGLVKNCPVQLDTIVTQINTRANDIEIITENAIFYADAVIITLPLGVLKKNVVTFNPPLPNFKQQAIQRLGMGVFNITAIKFPTPFWPEEAQAFFFTHYDTLSISTFFNVHYFIQQPILLGISGGESARKLENLSDIEVIEKIMHGFKNIFGSQLPEPECYFNTRWSHDPFSYGSYSYIPTESSGDDYEAMAKPVSNKLFFAGEATCSKYPATTHGAYLSGIREAERIKKNLLQC